MILQWHSYKLHVDRSVCLEANIKTHAFELDCNYVHYLALVAHANYFNDRSINTRHIEIELY